MGAKVLVADDSITIQTAVQLTFSRENIELIPARSGEEAIRKAKEVAPDLMLIDTVMPDASGYEVCRALKADPAMRDIPIIMLTGPFEAGDRSEGQTVGASDFIAKPFESRTLIRKVRQLLDTRPMSLSPPADVELEMATMEMEPRGPSFEDTGALLLEEEPAFTGSLIPPVIPLPLADQKSPTAFFEEPPAAAVPQSFAVPPEIPEPLLERAVTEAAERAVTQVVKEVMEKLAEQIEQIAREVVPDLAETLIIKEIERIKASIEGKTVQ